ncbi:immunoglobulin superfamily containing leucine-rich repeat protein 2-like [Branchiostoma lanceolatum]|uniref:immunoglobulin superfamily containing leucine-rich repeat protein 2-like n=1 Tax=Branchiostoma lanceolatum TaxID=7740 RepID=UPI0034554F8C
MEKLTTIPEDIPTSVTRLSLSYNLLRRLRVPPLERLWELNVKWNQLETVDWESLRNVPALKYLNLNHNRLTQVNLGAVSKDLPNLAIVHLEGNRLSSFNLHDLGFPFVGAVSVVKIDNNPFNCDCAMAWLVNRFRCLQESLKIGDDPTSCIRCGTCVFGLVKLDAMVCSSPERLRGVALSNVSDHLSRCVDEATTSKTPGLQTRRYRIEGTAAGHLKSHPKTNGGTHEAQIR